MISFIQNHLFSLVGLVLFGEALALVIGVLWVKKGNSSWNTSRNRRYLISDLAAGLILMLHYFLEYQVWFMYVIGVFLVISIVSHFSRTIEYLFKIHHKFCANKALFHVNNLKLVFLFGLLFTLIPF